MDGIGIKILSSWIVGNGDCIEVGGYRMSADGTKGKKLKPRKKRGKPISPAIRLEMQAKIAAARERRRCGAEISRRS